LAINVVTLKRQLKEEIKNIYLFYGEEAFLKEQYINTIKSKVVDGPLADFNFTLYQGKNASFEEFAETVGMYPQMAEKRLVVVKETPFLTLSDYEKSISELIATIPDFTVVIFCEENTKKIKKSLLTQIEKNGTVVNFETQSPTDLRTWVNKKFANSGKKMKTDDMDFLIEICERSLTKLDTECTKLIASSDGEVITRANISDLVQIPAEFKMYSMADKLLSGDADGAYSLLSEFKIRKESPTVVLSRIYSQLADRYMVAMLGSSSEDFFPPSRKFLVRRYISDSRKYDSSALRKLMSLCYEADQSIKTGKSEGWCATELVMAEFLNTKKYTN